MTDELKFPEGWANQQLYPSRLFGGVRKDEVWTPMQAGQLFVGFAIVNDGVSMLRDFLAVPTDAAEEDRVSAIGEAAEWVSLARDWTRDCVVPNVGDTDLSDLLSAASDNISFLVTSITEHVNRLVHRNP